MAPILYPHVPQGRRNPLMTRMYSVFVPPRCVALCGWLLLMICPGVSGQTNIWISPASQDWTNAASWSLGILPGTDQTIFITNAGFKAVGISPAGPINFPGSMTVSNLTVDAPNGSSNTLLLNFSGTNVPLVVLNQLTVGTNGTINNQFGALVAAEIAADSNPAVTIAGSVAQQGGYWSVSNAAVLMSSGSINMSGNSLFRTFNLSGGTFNESNGITTITNFTISHATYNLFNGTLSAAALNVSDGGT